MNSFIDFWGDRGVNVKNSVLFNEKVVTDLYILLSW